MRKVWSAKDSKQLRQSAEEKSDAPTASSPLTRVADEVLHELRVHQIELEMQNDNLRNTQVALEESRDRYIDLYDFAPVGYITLSSDGLVSEINLTACTLLGSRRRTLIDSRFARFVSANDSDAWRQTLAYGLRHSEKVNCEATLKRLDGTTFRARLDCLRHLSVGTRPLVRVAITDITEQTRVQSELRIAAIAFEQQQGMIVTDAKSVILRVNEAFTALTGYKAEEVVGKTPSILRSDRHDEEFFRKMWLTLITTKHWQGEIWNLRKNGKVYAEWLRISAVCTPQGLVTHYVGVLSDITANSEAEAEIHRLAYYDPLTQLPNRRLLSDRLGQATISSTRSGKCGAILFLDLDKFKTVNDMYGHHAGDLLLTELSQRLLGCVRGGDTVARLGGDEFVLLLEDLSEDLDEASIQARQLGNKIQSAVAQPFNIENRDYQCPASIGIRLFRGDEINVDDLLRHADLALYQSKTTGRNTLCFFDPVMQILQDRRNALFDDLRRATLGDQFSLHFQPQLNRSMTVVGAEALLRWAHPDRGLVAPNDFIKLAEETGLIVSIGHWVLISACAQIKAWEGCATTRDIRLAINASARQFRQPTFVGEVQQALAESGANPNRLIIELTESLVLHDIADTLEKMRKLNVLGVSFSLDDFGTGYSSLSYLTRLPLSEIKIDRSFIVNVPNKVNDAVVAQTIITMAKNLGLKVMAEGVETEDQRVFLDQLGSDAYQGYLFSPALPLVDFEQYVHHHCM